MNYINEAVVTPSVVLAGDSEIIDIKVKFSKNFNIGQSRLIFDMPAFLGYSRPSDFDQEDNGYVEVFCSNPNIQYKKRVWDMEVLDFPTDTKTSFKNMAQRIYVVDFVEGEIKEDDELILSWGYSRNGLSIGTKICTLVPIQNFMNTIHIKYYKNCNDGLPELGRSFKGYKQPKPDQELEVSYQVKPREANNIRIIQTGEKCLVKIQDRFSNLCEVQESEKILSKMGILSKGSFNQFGGFEVSEEVLEGIEIPLSYTRSSSMKKVYGDYNIYFGDLHTHSSHSNDCIEREKNHFRPDHSFDYAKDVAGIDFLAVTDHHQPWDIERNKIGVDNWGFLLDAVENKNINGEFLAFAGFEFRGERGDTQVILNEPFTYEEIDDSKLKNIKDLWSKFRGRDYISIPHFHNPGSLQEFDWYECEDKGVEPVLEIYSCHGSYENNQVQERAVPRIKSFREDRNVKYFLSNGYKYGITCNSDGHKGNPGANGLTAVYAKELTKEGIIEAIRKRNVYGTTNARIKLLFTIDNQLMGSTIKYQKGMPMIIDVVGENLIKSIEIHGDGKMMKRFEPKCLEFHIEEELDKQYEYIYVKVLQLDNHIAYSSPIFFE